MSPTARDAILYGAIGGVAAAAVSPAVWLLLTLSTSWRGSAGSDLFGAVLSVIAAIFVSAMMGAIFGLPTGLLLGGVVILGARRLRGYQTPMVLLSGASLGALIGVFLCGDSE